MKAIVLLSFFLFISCQKLVAQEISDSVTPVGMDTAVIDDNYVTEGDRDEEEGSEYFIKKDPDHPFDSVQTRKIQDEVIRKMKSEDAFWYADADIKKEKPKESKTRTPLGQQVWFRTLLLVIIIGGFGAFLAIYLSGSNVGLFRRRDRTLPPGEEGEEILTEDIFAINYQKEIDKAAEQGNFRLAIRLMFLRLLKNLSEKNIIKYTQDKTNFDYLLQLHPTKYYANFFRITRHYEYSWYGHFDVNEDAYKQIRGDVDQFEKEIRP